MLLPDAIDSSRLFSLFVFHEKKNTSKTAWLGVVAAVYIGLACASIAVCGGAIERTVEVGVVQPDAESALALEQVAVSEWSRVMFFLLCCCLEEAERDGSVAIPLNC